MIERRKGITRDASVDDWREERVQTRDASVDEDGKRVETRDMSVVDGREEG
jgi:hypothetical protein